MRTRKKYMLQALLMIACALGGISCDEEISDVVGNPNTLFFFKANHTHSFEFTIVNTPLSSFGDEIKVKVPVRATRSLTEDVTITATVDLSLVDRYNSSHQTEYLAFPKELVNLTKTTVTIPAGSYASMDSLQLEVPKSVYGELEKGNYLLPFRLDRASSGNVTSTAYNVVWIFINSEYKEIRDNIVINEIEGAMVGELRSGWTASSSSFVTDFSLIFDNDPNTFVRFPSSDNASMVVDLQKPHVVTALCLGSVRAYALASVNVELSLDNKTWHDMGNASYLTLYDNYKVLGFYVGKEARYIRLSEMQWEYPVSGTLLSEFTIFSPDDDFIIGVESISLNKQTLSLVEGGGETLIATVFPQNATNKRIVWKSSDPSVATVGENGEVLAIKVGESTITATTADGNKEAMCVVKVVKDENLLHNPSFEIASLMLGNQYKDGKYWNVYTAEKKENWGNGAPYSSIRNGFPQYVSQGSYSLILHSNTRYLTQRLDMEALKPNTQYQISYDFFTSSQASENGGAVYQILLGTKEFGNDILEISAHRTPTTTESKQTFKTTFTTPSTLAGEVWFALYRVSGHTAGVDWLDNMRLQGLVGD